jgi:hypothetical protein
MKTVLNDFRTIYGGPLAIKKFTESQRGGDITENIHDAFTGDNHHVKNALSDYAEWEVDTVYIYRQPVEKAITKLLSMISKKFGKYKMYWDELYHLFLVFKIVSPDGKTTYIRTEKNPRIQFFQVDSFNEPSKDKLNFNVSKLGRHILFGDVIGKTKKILGSNYLTYDMKNNNCQLYVLSIVKAIWQLAGLSMPDIYRNYIYQNVSVLIDEGGYLHRIGKKITDLGGFFNAIIGKGLY